MRSPAILEALANAGFAAVAFDHLPPFKLFRFGHPVWGGLGHAEGNAGASCSMAVGRCIRIRGRHGIRSKESAGGSGRSGAAIGGSLGCCLGTRAWRARDPAAG